MTLRSIFPYIVIVFLFAFIYWLTMVIPTKMLYAIWGWEWKDARWNSKTRPQNDIFSFGLPLSLLMVNTLEICTTVKSKFAQRILKSMLTIILTFMAGWCVYMLIGAPLMQNMYHSYRGVPARLFCMISLFFTFFGLIILELIQLIFFALLSKEKITACIPRWLRMEALPTNSSIIH